MFLFPINILTILSPIYSMNDDTAPQLLHGGGAAAAFALTKNKQRKHTTYR